MLEHFWGLGKNVGKEGWEIEAWGWATGRCVEEGAGDDHTRQGFTSLHGTGHAHFMIPLLLFYGLLLGCLT
jgi:hypothetical protein